MKLYVIKAPYPFNVASDANEFVESNHIREATSVEILEAAELIADEPVKAIECVFPLVKECLLVHPTSERVSY